MSLVTFRRSAILSDCESRDIQRIAILSDFESRDIQRSAILSDCESRDIQCSAILSDCESRDIQRSAIHRKMGQRCLTCCSDRFLQFHMERGVISGCAIGTVGSLLHTSKLFCSKFKFI